MNKLLATGCSFAHASETVSNNYDLQNINFSYARYVADHLNAEYTNLAYPGASNEFIFHRTISAITTNDYTHCLVSWTSLYRESWEKDGVIWQFNLNYGNCIDSKSSELPFIKRHKISNLQSNVRENLAAVVRYWPEFRRKILTDDLELKLKNYRKTIQAICQINNVHLIEINALENSETDLDCIANMNDIYYKSKIHPTIQQHKLIAERIIQKYYNEQT